MSALWADDDDAGSRARTRSGSNRSRATRGHRNTPAASKSSRRDSGRRLARIPFVAVLILIFGVGMAGLLALNTTLQDQSFRARNLTERSDKLAHREAALEHQSRQLRAPDRLANQAWQLGLRPNDQHAVLNLSNGKVIGKPVPASKHAMPGIKSSITTDQQAAANRGGEAPAGNLPDRPGGRVPGGETLR